VLPLADGSAPTADFVVKGNANWTRSHRPGSPYYRRTRAEVWFRTEQDAVAAGFPALGPEGRVTGHALAEWHTTPLSIMRSRPHVPLELDPVAAAGTQPPPPAEPLRMCAQSKA